MIFLTHKTSLFILKFSNHCDAG